MTIVPTGVLVGVRVLVAVFLGREALVIRDVSVDGGVLVGRGVLVDDGASVGPAVFDGDGMTTGVFEGASVG
jgi:UDP-3-O-[3-hydroxymyristoyl] glucosamine N-acyltransferase